MDIYAEAARRGLEAGYTLTEEALRVTAEDLNVETLMHDANLQAEFNEGAFAAAVEFYSKLLAIAMRYNMSENEAIALHRIAHAYEYSRIGSRDDNLRMATGLYIRVAQKYQESGNLEESAAAIGRAAGCLINEANRDSDQIRSMIQMIDNIDTALIESNRTIGILLFNKSQLISLQALNLTEKPDALLSSYRALGRAGDYFRQAGEPRDALLHTQRARILIDLIEAKTRLARISVVQDNLHSLPRWLQPALTRDIENLSETIELNPLLLGLDSTPTWIVPQKERESAVLEIRSEIASTTEGLRVSAREFDLHNDRLQTDPVRLRLALEWARSRDLEILQQIVDRIAQYPDNAPAEELLSSSSEFVLPVATNLNMNLENISFIVRFCDSYRAVSERLSAFDLEEMVKQSPVILRFCAFALAASGEIDHALRVLQTARQLLLTKKFPQLQLHASKRTVAKQDAVAYLITAPSGTALIVIFGDHREVRILRDLTSKDFTVATNCIAPMREGILRKQELGMPLGDSLDRAGAICAPVTRALHEISIALDFHSVTLMTTGTAGVLPWDAMPLDSAQLLGDTLLLALTPFMVNTSEPPTSCVDGSVFALPGGGGSGALPGVQREAEIVGNQIQSVCVNEPEIKNSATRVEILDAFSARNFVHIATHSGLNFNEPLKSAIITADGEVSATELLHVDTSDLELAVLSSCESGKVNPFYLPDDVVSLQSCLVFGGSRRVVASLWPVDDTATLLFMSRFYESLAMYHSLSTNAVRTSLRVARAWIRSATVRELRSHCERIRIASSEAPGVYTPNLDAGDVLYSSPEFWAAFSLMVRDRPLAASGLH